MSALPLLKIYQLPIFAGAGFEYGLRIAKENIIALATLSIDLVARLAQYEADMGKAARVAEKTASQMAGAFGLIKSAAGGLAAGIGVGGLIALTRSTIDSLDALNDLKDATGASIENISALEDVAGRTGTSMDAVGASLVKFNAALKDVKPGSDAAAAFKALGLSVKDLKALDPAEALRQTAVALAGFADDGNKARLTQELFGKSLREVAPFLKDLAEQGSLVAKVTTQQAEEAEKFNKQLFAMQKNFQDLARFLSSDLVTAINASGEAFRTGGLLAGLSRLYGGSDEFKLNKQLVDAVEKQLGIEKELQELRKRGFSEDSRGMKTQLANLVAINAEIKSIQQKRSVTDPDNQSAAETARLMGRLPSLPAALGKTVGADKSARVVKGIDFENKAVMAYIDSLDRQLQKAQDLTAVEEAYIELSKKGAGATLEEAAAVYAKARAIDKLREDEARIALKRSVQADGGVDNSAYQARLKALMDSTESQVFKRQQEDLEFLKDALEKSRIGVDGYSEAVRKLFGITDDNMEKSKSLAEELGLSFTSAFEDAIVGGKKFSDVLKGLEQDILRIVTRDQVTRPLADSIGKLLKGDGSGGNLFSNIGGALGKVLGFEGGGFTGYGPRIGGLDGHGGMLAMVHPNETVIDHTRGQVGNTQTINITVNPPASMSRQTGMQLGADIARQLRIAESRNG